MIPENHILEISNLDKSYGVNPILNGINLNAGKGDIISIIGRSGCGKTTLLRCVNCLEPFENGNINVCGVSIKGTNLVKGADSSEKSGAMMFRDFGKAVFGDEQSKKVTVIRSKVGMLFQNLNLFPHLNIIENVSKPLRIIRKIDRESAKFIAEQTLDKVGILNLSHRYPHQISGGQAQRAAIARALALSPQLMLYDEPTSALDPELVDEIIQTMLKLKSEGMTQLIVTHSLRFSKMASDYVVYMENGKVIEKSRPEIIFTKPEDERTQKYLSTIIS